MKAYWPAEYTSTTSSIPALLAVDAHLIVPRYPPTVHVLHLSETMTIPTQKEVKNTSVKSYFVLIDN